MDGTSIRASVLIVAVVGAMALAGPLPAQPPRGAEAESAIRHWLGLVAGAAPDRAWAEASDFFQYRITEVGWREWVYGHAAELRGAGPRREVEFAVGHDQPPLAPLDWVRVTYVRDRPAGGRIFEQVIVFEENDQWRVAHYGAWIDPTAVVHNASLSPVPYLLGYRGQYTFREFPLRFRGPRPHPRPNPAPAERPRNLANPETFRRPPT
jgi:hypothetical protein